MFTYYYSWYLPYDERRSDPLKFLNKDFERLSIQYLDIILRHNKKIILAHKSIHKKYVKSYIKWRSYNTPNTSSLQITPLHGTAFIKYSDHIVDEWIISIYMLILEYNFIKKVLIYMTSDKSIPLSDEYKKCYIYWQTRQNLLIENSFSLFSKLKLNKGIVDLGNTFVPLPTLDKECFLREVIEDFLYIALNILLAKSILENPQINKYLDNQELLFKELAYIYKEHFLTYKAEYNYLYKIREYSAYNFVSLEELKFLHKKML